MRLKKKMYLLSDSGITKVTDNTLEVVQKQYQDSSVDFIFKSHPVVKANLELDFLPGYIIGNANKTLTTLDRAYTAKYTNSFLINPALVNEVKKEFVI